MTKIRIWAISSKTAPLHNPLTPPLVKACAKPRDPEDLTWIDQRMVDAYCALHAAGHARDTFGEKDQRLDASIAA